MNPIKTLRTQQGITRRQLAQSTGISYPTLSNIEQGLPLTISHRIAQKIGVFFAIETRDIQSQYETYRQALSN